MSEKMVPLCLLHSVPHPCGTCSPDRAAAMAAFVEAIPLREPGGSFVRAPEPDDFSAVESAVHPDALAELAYAKRVDDEARAFLASVRLDAPADDADAFEVLSECLSAHEGDPLPSERRIRAAMATLPVSPLVRFKRFHDRAVVPEYAKPGDAGADLRTVESVRLRPFEPVKVRLGIGIELPPGYEAQIRPRSSLNSQGVAVLLGTIDQGYRGELSATMVLLNRGYADYEIHIGDKVAQLVIAPVARATFVEGELGESARGAGGFGSTGR